MQSSSTVVLKSNSYSWFSDAATLLPLELLAAQQQT